MCGVGWGGAARDFISLGQLSLKASMQTLTEFIQPVSDHLCAL